WASRSWAASSGACSATSRRCRGCSTRRRWWWACSLRWRSPSWSSGSRSPGCAPPSTSRRAWSSSSRRSSSGRRPGLARSERIPIRTQEDVVRVHQTVREAAVAVGFTLVEQTKVVTAASELARNTLVHGGGGELLLDVVNGQGPRGVRLVFEDEGPGIADVALALKEGYSTGTGLGLGLSGAKKLMSEFEIDSEVGRGTRVVAARWK